MYYEAQVRDVDQEQVDMACPFQPCRSRVTEIVTATCNTLMCCCFPWVNHREPVSYVRTLILTIFFMPFFLILMGILDLMGCIFVCLTCKLRREECGCWARRRWTWLDYDSHPHDHYNPLHVIKKDSEKDDVQDQGKMEEGEEDRNRSQRQMFVKVSRWKSVKVCCPCAGVEEISSWDWDTNSLQNPLRPSMWSYHF